MAKRKKRAKRPTTSGGRCKYGKVSRGKNKGKCRTRRKSKRC